ncbi:MAG: hypothetical protein FGM33_05685 [Candidatus Kapabacteria bacterium]|nr:hypothetical protein [Candidatus Kapabacteria bacterium]
MTRILLIVLSAMALATSSHAQDQRSQDQRSKRREAVKELRSDLRSWYTREVLPTVSRMHTEYDASLSREDLATLTTLRADAKRLRNDVRKDMQSLKSDFQRGGRAELRDRLKDLRTKHRDEYKRLVERVKPIAKRSRTKLRELFDANEDKIEQWRAQAKKIVGDWKDDHDDLDMGNRDNSRFPLLGGDPRRSALRFILWDGTTPDE